VVHDILVEDILVSEVTPMLRLPSTVLFDFLVKDTMYFRKIDRMPMLEEPSFSKLESQKALPF